MKRKFTVTVITALCFLFIFSSCSAMLNRDFVYSQAHEIPSSPNDKGNSSITSREELTLAIEDMVSSCREEQSFRLADYTEDIDGEIKTVIGQVYSEPLGSYAVSNILYKTSLILNYYELTLNISYNCNPSDIENIIPLTGRMDLKMVLAEELPENTEKLIFSSDRYETLADDIEDCLLEVYLSNPVYAVGLAGYEYRVYPAAGAMPCIVELDIKYTEPHLLLFAKAKGAEMKLEEISALSEDCQTELETVKFFHDYLASGTVYDTETEKLAGNSLYPERTAPFSVYGALVDNKAVSEGYALAMKALCNTRGITCQLVSGYDKNVSHTWNRVYVGGKWYNVDAAADSLGEGTAGYEFFCVTDEKMLERFAWDASSKKYCRSELTGDELLSLGIGVQTRQIPRYEE